ncbi:MAG: class I SAM-dependent methyltransferase [Intrasporangium sp.]|uniref:class I SAM-dependent methyltransferase n=1 Tax=Intrasporangium sp. TaxID=1925024 RepID=UPI002647CF20|nr:class I SAM-dependent methyltransferase [Intrasporangium sp.]MDN5795969.1 class I SAM-dependent methyltransferase [Intrasporangium sp.]
MTAPPATDPVLAGRLRADLLVAGLTVDGVAARLGTLAAAALRREQSLPALVVTDDATDVSGILLRLFTLGRPVPAAALDAALPSLGVAGAIELGLVRVLHAEREQEEVVQACCDLRPYADDTHDWWVASDLGKAVTSEPLTPDHVLGISGASTTLASWTIRRPVRRVLDLGVGCGVQALHLAAHCESIVGTDVSERALAFASFNAELAGVRLDLRHGDLLDPVVGERFDLVVSNPPFVITPRDGDVPYYIYRDGGRAGDTLVRSLVRSVGEVLEPGGVAQFLGNWEVPVGRTWRDVWSEWLAGVGLDAWVVQREVQDPAEYAELWARDGGTVPGTPAHDRMYAAWLRDFASRGVESVGYGFVTLQRPGLDREPWVSLDEVPGPVAEPMGPTIDAGLRARTWLAEHPDDDLLSVAWSCAPDVTEERYGRPGAEDPAVILVRQGGGLRRVVQAGTWLAGYLGVADGSLRAGVALDAMASVLGVSEAEVRAELVPQIRDLVADGLLVR